MMLTVPDATDNRVLAKTVPRCDTTSKAAVGVEATNGIPANVSVLPVKPVTVISAYSVTCRLPTSMGLDCGGVTVLQSVVNGVGDVFSAVHVETR